MIKGAIEALNDSNGSSKSAIAKHIESTYGDLPKSHTALLAHHLNRMKDTGELVLVKNNYIKPDPNAEVYPRPRRHRLQLFLKEEREYASRLLMVADKTAIFIISSQEIRRLCNEENLMGSIAKKGLQQYLLQLQHHLLRTKAITVGILSAISDIVSQKLTGIQKLQIRRLFLKVMIHIFRSATDGSVTRSCDRG
ncbi:hypothetical protein ACFX2I_022931 [Malus domestica]